MLVIIKMTQQGFEKTHSEILNNSKHFELYNFWLVPKHTFHNVSLRKQKTTTHHLVEQYSSSAVKYRKNNCEKNVYRAVLEN